MRIVVDIGNNRVKWARATGGRLSSTGSAVHVADPESAMQCLSESFRQSVTRVVATNVAGSKIKSLFEDTVERHWGLQPEMIDTASMQLGVTCGYDEPRRLGADRWVAMLAAWNLCNGAICVIDAGTAVTLDLVDSRGQHLGGLILAGPRVAASALSLQTSEIGATRASDDMPEGLAILGHSTDEAVAYGAMLSVAAAVDRALQIICAQLGDTVQVLLTGGDAPALTPWLQSTVQYRQHLVLEGLALIAESS